ncbi:hypothetical protein ABZ807_21150 [Micromonospora sp. NPDC047548]|uniref:hypothetical protein n=1 Tax=Micromonospora sp. NPDC047548 TaxID=3155624 RepID=UPI00340CADE4
MSASRIEFSGDDLAQRVPLLAQFQEDLIKTVNPLVDIAACRWADDVPEDDEVTLQARAAVQGMLMKYVFPAFVELGDVTGIQHDKWDFVRRIADNTEAISDEMVGDLGGGRY